MGTLGGKGLTCYLVSITIYAVHKTYEKESKLLFLSVRRGTRAGTVLKYSVFNTLFP